MIVEMTTLVRHIIYVKKIVYLWDIMHQLICIHVTAPLKSK